MSAVLFYCKNKKETIMYNLDTNEILLVDGCGDGAGTNRNNSGGYRGNHTSYGGQGGGFVGTQSNGRNLGSACGLAVAGAVVGGLGMISSGGFSGYAAVSSALGAASACRN
jgi:hypothetical protein